MGLDLSNKKPCHVNCVMASGIVTLGGVIQGVDKFDTLIAIHAQYNNRSLLSNMTAGSESRTAQELILHRDQRKIVAYDYRAGI